MSAKVGERLPCLLSALKAPRIAERLAETAERAREEHWPYEQFLETLCEAEVFAREASGARTRTRSAGFRRTRPWRTSTSPPSPPPSGRW
jgi:DNA replication protein DnaC